MLPQILKQQAYFTSQAGVKSNVIKRITIVALLSFTTLGSQLRAQTVDATTMNNKVMAGYQGWFRAPGDRAGNKGWSHWFNAAVPSAGKLAFDTWPDVSELSKDEKYAVPGFTNPDGSQAYLYSPQNPKTVLRHFQWMQQAGIDGVWLSEFGSHFPGASQHNDASDMLRVMENVRRAATATGRTWAFMYDMSGLSPANIYTVILHQWEQMVDDGVTSDPRYMHHNGKPVLLLWGFFPSRLASQPAYCKPLVDFLQSPGKYQATLVGGGDPNWRSQGTPEFQAMLMSMTAWQPWSVGRVRKDPATGYKVSNNTLWAGDMAKCKANNVIFIPVINAGTHIAGPPPIAPALPIVPRRNGNFLWEQFAAASKAGGINSVFVAMFDEVNEGTEIMKVTNTPPTQADFLTFEGATSDWYLRLVGLGGKMLRSGQPITSTIPISPFDPNKWYKIKNKANGLVLNNQGKTTNATALVQSPETDTQTNLEWQLIYDGAGYFKIKSRSSGKVVSNGGLDNAAITQVNDLRADSQEWQLEWDGTGFCRIRSKANGKAISNNASNTPNSALVQVTDKDSDDLRWQIIPQ
jgi:hypothetical protein